MSDDKDQWKQTASLAADSTVAQIICKEPDKEEWDEESEEKSYRSTSKYLYELVQEARAYRQQGYLAHHQSEGEMAELKSRIEELETQLEREQEEERDDEETIQAIERFKFTRPSNDDSDYLFLSIRGDRVSKTQVQRAVKDAAVDRV